MTVQGGLCCFHHLQLGPAVGEQQLAVSINAAERKRSPGLHAAFLGSTRWPRHREFSTERLPCAIKYSLTIDTDKITK